MPEPTDILFSLSVGERMALAMGATEEHAAASEAASVRVEKRQELFEAHLDQRLDALEARFAPALDAFKEQMDALAREKAATIAARAEGRGALERLITSKAAFVIYGVIVAAIATYISGLRGCVPEPVREAVTHAAEASPDAQ